MKRFLWDGWEVVDKIGEGRFSDVYKAVKKVDGMNLYCAIKHISLPKNIEEIEELKRRKIVQNEEDIYRYYANLIGIIRHEIDTIKTFQGNSYIINYFDYFRELKQNQLGQDIYIRMELAEDINSYFNNRKYEIIDIIKMAINICSALELCLSVGLIHKDVKPSNIFIGADGNYKLGDFGTSSSLNNYSKNISGTYNYMSPEVYNRSNLTNSTDIYSLGLVMYKFLNNNNLPFVNEHTNEKEALEMRMSGKKIPVIKNLDNEVMSIIFKACSYSSIDRYQNPTMMKKDLEKVLNKLLKNKKEKKYNVEKTISIYDEESSDDNLNDMMIDKIKIQYSKMKKISKGRIKEIIKEVFYTIIIAIIILLLVRKCFFESETKVAKKNYINIIEKKC